MKVSDLIEKLKNLPQDSEIESLYDLGCWNSIDHVWLARNGKVYVCPKNEWFSDDDKWPIDAKANWERGYSKEMTEWTPDL
jgi:hypothetical protein